MLLGSAPAFATPPPHLGTRHIQDVSDRRLLCLRAQRHRQITLHKPVPSNEAVQADLDRFDTRERVLPLSRGVPKRSSQAAQCQGVRPRGSSCSSSCGTEHFHGSAISLRMAGNGFVEAEEAAAEKATEQRSARGHLGEANDHERPREPDDRERGERLESWAEDATSMPAHNRRDGDGPHSPGNLNTSTSTQGELPLSSGSLHCPKDCGSPSCSRDLYPKALAKCASSPDHLHATTQGKSSFSSELDSRGARERIGC